eukprot:g31662.t1
MVCCLPGARVRDISDLLQRILEREGEDPVVVVHVRTNNISKTRKEDPFRDYQELEQVFKGYNLGITAQVTCKSIQGRKNKRCIHLAERLVRERGVPYHGILASVLEQEDLYRWDGLHLNRAGAIVLAERKGERQKTGNYRPISLTSVIAKILESIVKDEIAEYLEVHEFYEEVMSRLELGEPMDVIYLDFQKAFDKVPHRRLL